MPATAFANIAGAHREIYALYEIAKAIGSSLGVVDTMSLIADKLTALVPFSCCALFVADDDGVVRCRFSAGVDGEELKRIRLQAGLGHPGWVIDHRQSLVNASPAHDFEAAGLATAAQNLRSALMCPLVASGQVVGVIALYHVAPDFYMEDHRRLLDRISEQAAAAISNSIVFEQTREESLSDALTGLPNTRYLVGHVARELARAERHDSQMAILVLDLDDFKSINDTLGHHVGDQALREVADVFRRTIRPYDDCVRYAGDEFIPRPAPPLNFPPRSVGWCIVNSGTGRSGTWFSGRGSVARMRRRWTRTSSAAPSLLASPATAFSASRSSAGARGSSAGRTAARTGAAAALTAGSGGGATVVSPVTAARTSL